MPANLLSLLDTWRSKYMDGPKVRVSKSKSRFSKDQSHFKLVYKSETGKYFKPIIIAVDDAINIARSYALHKSGDLERGVTRKAAKCIYNHASELGLLDVAGPDSGLEGPLTEEVAAETVVELKNQETEISFAPRFFPNVEFDQPVVLDQEKLEVLSFILAEVDPVNRETNFTPLRELADEPRARIAGESALEQDHQYLLPQWHNFPLRDFHESWVDYKRTQISGQAETDLRKILQNVERFQIDDDGKRLRAGQHREFLVTVQDYALPLLYRIYRRARSKINGELEKREAVSKPTSFLDRITKSMTKTKESARVEQPFLEATERYIHLACKLGRLLRSPLLGD